MNARRCRTLRTIIVVSALALGASGVGCASSDHKTQKQVATAQWNHTRATVLCSLASDQYKGGNLDKCRETLNTAIPMDPTNVELALLSARVYIEQGNLENAQADLTRAATLAPAEAEVDYLTGVVQQRWERPEMARDAYARAVVKKPSEPAYLLAQAEMLVQLHDAPGAMALLQARVNYFEHSAAIRDAIAQLFEQTGNLDAAIDYYREASVLDGDDLGIRERLGLALYQHGDDREALTQLNRVLRGPSSAGRNDLQVAAGACELNLNLPVDARKRYEAVVAADPSNAMAWLGAAKAALAVGDIRRADYATGRALTLPPTASQPSTWAVMGYVRLRQGRFDDAVGCFRRASTGDPKDTTSLCMLGLSLSKLGRTTEARACYTQVLATSPNDELATQLQAAATVTASAND